ncbi:MAG: FecR domain-containing protein [Elusimicrobia bacterium]|nr:FecR domain-containing protein [Elusimicrobiota bacterium]MDE2426528.1 FecR domain-containing protein [Elusimicrobiota bacterium]
MRNSFLLLALFAAPLAAAPAVPAAAPIPIGAAAAVRGTVEALLPAPGAVGRILGSGAPVYLNDKITTGPNGRLQVLLRDETVFTIGPNTTLILDKFVYDPSTDLGQVSASITRGFFRFITGKIAKKHPSNMKVTLPVCTIGIHGTDVMGHVGPGQATVVLKSGGIRVGNQAGSVMIERPDFCTTVGAGHAPVHVFAAPPSMLDALASALAPRPVLPAPQAPAAPPAGKAVLNKPVLDALLTQTSQDSLTQLVDGATSNWDDVRKLSGSGLYTANGSFSAAGNECTAPGQCSWNFNFTADFQNRFLNGTASVTTTDVGNVPSGTIDSTNLNSLNTDWSSLSGSAVLTVPMSGLTNNGGGYNFNTCSAGDCYYRFTFQNKGGRAAGQVKGESAIADAPITGTGQTLTAPRQ